MLRAAAVGVAVALSGSAGAAPPTDAAGEAFVEAVEEMKALAASVRDATWTFHSSEWVDAEMTPLEVMFVKFRTPNEVYMKWTGDQKNGQEVLWRQGFFDDKLIANPPGIVPTLRLQIDGRLATRGTRHTIDHTSILRTVDKVVRDTERIVADASLAPTVIDLGETTVHGTPSRCFRTDLPKYDVPELYGHRIELCIGTATRLPTSLKAWDHEDGAVRMVENYGFENVRINVGLTDRDFDPDNDEYGF